MCRETGSSPLSRGIRLAGRGPGAHRRIIPALAGNTRCRRRPFSASTDHPRSRGEYAPQKRDEYNEFGSSPLSRGIRPARIGEKLRRGIIPALAGNTSPLSAKQSGGRDHPRSRGEYARERAALGVYEGSSPLSRGIPDLGAAGINIGGIIPALAGNTDSARVVLAEVGDHPRSRGEYATVWPAVTFCPGSSPLSRGIPDSDVEDSRGGGIIPALAGNTFGVWCSWGSSSDHPRSRGEYPEPRYGDEFTAGSSPLSRGIRDPAVLAGPSRRIIPALAGNTTHSCNAADK